MASLAVLQGSLVSVLALAIPRNGQVVEGGVAQVPFGPGGTLHRAYHVGEQLRECLCLLLSHVLIGHVEHQPAVRRRLRCLLLTRYAAGGAARGGGLSARLGRGCLGLSRPFSLAMLVGGRSFVEVGAGHRWGLSRAGLVDVDVLGLAREQGFERDAVHHRRARPIALLIRSQRREGILDLFCSTLLVVGVAVFASTHFFAPFFYGAGAGMDVRQVHRPRAGKSRALEYDLLATIGLREGGRPPDAGTVRRL